MLSILRVVTARLVFQRGGSEMTIFAFPPSAFIPVVVGLFGLGTGYFIWGGQALFGYPKPTPEVEKTMGMWGFSVLGIVVFVVVPDIPVAIVFIGLALIYLTDSPTRFGVFPAGGRLVGLWQALTGIWLLYLTWAFTSNLTLNM